ncbi:MAG: hypothetical protein RL434_1779 [Pseudomonadota bacterium]|jgi:hypothetical protein
MKQEFGPVTFQWQEHPQGAFGPGVSRAANLESAKKFTLLVKQQAAKPMKVTLFAENRTAAKKYALARWPGAAVEVAA